MENIKYVGKLVTPINRKLAHSHDYWELVRYTTGHGKVEIGAETYDFTEGDVFIIPPLTEHTDYSETGFQNYHCEFADPDFPFSSLLIFRDSETDDFLNLLVLLFNEYQRKRNNDRELLNSMYAVLLQYILLYSEQSGRHHPYVDYAVRQIVENYADPYYDFSVTSPHIPFHPDYFRRVFLEDMGCTPAQYLTRQRVRNARKLLTLRKQSRQSIREIAWLSGFRDNLYFSRVFREQVGMSPTEYVQSVSAKK